VINPELGVAEVLTDAEQIELYACEEVIGSCWNTFVQVGLALARIRDGHLYKTDFHTFEDYCRVKWEYGRNYVNHLISAAQVFTFLVTAGHQKPEHEKQVRPLTGLTPEQAQLAWERAVEIAHGRKITERMVKAAVQQLQGASDAQPATRKPRQSKAQQRQLINEAIGQLLVLLSQKISYDVLTEKVEALHGHIQALFPKPTPKA
jgi:hypothetical protein